MSVSCTAGLGAEDSVPADGAADLTARLNARVWVGPWGGWRRGAELGGAVRSWAARCAAPEKAMRPAESRTTERGMTMRAAAMQRANSSALTWAGGVTVSH